MANLIEAWQVNLAQVIVKFEPSVKVSSITNERFTLMTDAATPSVVSNDPFETIVTAEDYNSISKTLTLTWKPGMLMAETAYKIRLSGFRAVDNSVIADDYIHFVTEDSVVPDPGDIPIEPEAFVIEDYSIVPDAFYSDIIVDGGEPDEPATPNYLTVTSADPLQGDYYLPEDYNSGRAVIKFNVLPATGFINSNYFKTQRKPYTRRPSRWESVAVQIAFDSENPWVYIYFPSTDTPPVYGVPGKTYFEKNYKYRVIVSKQITT